MFGLVRKSHCSLTNLFTKSLLKGWEGRGEGDKGGGLRIIMIIFIFLGGPSLELSHIDVSNDGST